MWYRRRNSRPHFCKPARYEEPGFTLLWLLPRLPYQDETIPRVQISVQIFLQFILKAMLNDINASVSL